MSSRSNPDEPLSREDRARLVRSENYIEIEKIELPKRSASPARASAPASPPRPKVIVQVGRESEKLVFLPRELTELVQVEWRVTDAHAGTDSSARAVMRDIDSCLRRGADIVVTTDAEIPFDAADLRALVEPIVMGRAQIVVGERPIVEDPDVSVWRRGLEEWSPRIVRIASNTRVRDAESRFRALSRAAALQLCLVDDGSPTLETIVQAGRTGLVVETTSIGFDSQRPDSPEIERMPTSISSSLSTAFRSFVTYRPLSTFLIAGSVPFIAGSLLWVRWLVFAVGADATDARIPSLIAAATLMSLGVMLGAVGVIGERLASHRRLLEDVRLRVRKIELRPSEDTPDTALLSEAPAPTDAVTSDDAGKDPTPSAIPPLPAPAEPETIPAGISAAKPARAPRPGVDVPLTLDSRPPLPVPVRSDELADGATPRAQSGVSTRR